MKPDPPSKRKHLGRGLAALLGAPPNKEARAATPQLQTLPITELHPCRYQPRRRFAEEQIIELAQSVREKGILQPLVVRPDSERPGTYDIICGERRWRAAQAAQLYEVPIIVKELDDSQALEVALIENVQRQDLTPLEEAEGYHRLMEEFNNTQEDLAQTVGKSRSHVAKIIRLLGLPEAVKAMLQDGSLSAGHGRALLSAEDPEVLARAVVRRGLNVRQTEALVKKPQKTTVSSANRGEETDVNTLAMEKQLSEKLGLTVKINHRGEKGEVRIAFTSLEQFDEILNRLNQHPHG